MTRILCCRDFSQPVERSRLVVLQRRSTEESWGLKISTSEDGLFIQELQDSPSLAKWHQEHPAPRCQIQPALAILEVNGKEDSEEIFDQFRTATLVEMTLSSVMTLSQQQNFAIAAKRDRKEKELAAVGELLHAVDGATAGQCSICLDEMQQDSKVVQLSCGHVFHKACVKKWLLTKRMTCPLCKQTPVAEKARGCSHFS
ncbi:Probable E3 ubiquitin-protein ligase XERICO (RING-type E3 ubiquitin transferase XERICO) [Durusdinium trenchii]|uniref:Probable E3 ubiquitin-protein ligase XERICO (RING-type E3 ubiquitin transferase XERICO) n=1 Tax=Durusdinium trenchii TaxID=1381693 RepID=A0ABP0JGP1_9DINO